VQHLFVTMTQLVPLHAIARSSGDVTLRKDVHGTARARE